MTFPIKTNATLLVFIVLVLTFQMQVHTGWTFEFVLAALISLSLFLKPLEVTFLSVMSSWVLNWRPALSIEMVLLVCLPLLVCLVRNKVPMEGWQYTSFASFLGTFLFYAVSNADALVQHGSFFVLDALVSALVSIAVFSVMRHSSEEQVLSY